MIAQIQVGCPHYVAKVWTGDSRKLYAQKYSNKDATCSTQL